MAAQEDNESHQQFPVASFAVPSRTELEERLVLALNTRDGQQSCAQDGADPYTRAVRYVEQHRIVEIFQNITSRIAYERPDDPLQFMLNEIEKVRKGQKLETLK
ncbi:Testis-specific expressed protein 55 [Geodia barretti]|uniref:Testis-specific expressed protein 55 n=1 Tax=Geodia barretti TaxID=519541 RepID=A0AA35TW14_GEOBA|nr:Testis-specific expressed protein 55 [Geodia barretti]